MGIRIKVTLKRRNELIR